jgi:hypothetical protein
LVFRVYPIDSDRPPPPRPVFTIAPSGQGRVWEARAAEGFWRDFVEIDFGDADAVLKFVQRRGDPWGLLEQDAETLTQVWYGIAAILGAPARAYEPAGADGISRFTTDRQRRLEAESFLKNDAELLRAVEPILDPAGRSPYPVLRAKTLAAFMALSAAHAVEQRLPMRRCAHCASWFHIGRSDAQFCSGTCRAAKHNSSTREGQTQHGQRAQEGRQRADNLAKPMARTRAERKGPAADKKLPERQGRKGSRRQN